MTLMSLEGQTVNMKWSNIVNAKIKYIYKDAIIKTRRNVNIKQKFAIWKRAVIEIGGIAKTKKEDSWFAAACQHVHILNREMEVLNTPAPDHLFPPV